jgi:hypothetical protein
MRAIAVVIGAILLGCPLVLSADQIKPGLRVDFGKGLKPLPKTPPPTGDAAQAPFGHVKDRSMSFLEVHKRRHSTAPARDPIDCQMVRPVSPTFHSHMRVLKPPTDIKFSMKVIEAPPCRK